MSPVGDEVALTYSHSLFAIYCTSDYETKDRRQDKLHISVYSSA